MKKRKMMLALAATIGISASTFLWAGRDNACHYDPQAKVAKHADRLAKKLKLSDDQKAKVKEIMAASSQKMEAVQKQTMELHESSSKEIEAILTPEQKQKFDKINGHKAGCCGVPTQK